MKYIDYEKIEILLALALLASLFSGIVTIIIQKIKEKIKIKASVFSIISALLSVTLGSLSIYLFSDFPIVYCIVGGMFIFAGADVIYKYLEDSKHFKSIDAIAESTYLKVNKTNQINFENEEE